MCCIYSDFFLFKQKTAYEMRISDWSSDVCSSDLGSHGFFLGATRQHLYDSGRPPLQFRVRDNHVDHLALIDLAELQHDSRRDDVDGGLLGRASLHARRPADDLASGAEQEDRKSVV